MTWRIEKFILGVASFILLVHDWLYGKLLAFFILPEMQLKRLHAINWGLFELSLYSLSIMRLSCNIFIVENGIFDEYSGYQNWSVSLLGKRWLNNWKIEDTWIIRKSDNQNFSWKLCSYTWMKIQILKFIWKLIWMYFQTNQLEINKHQK